MALHILSPLHRATRQVSLSLAAAIREAGLDLSSDEGHALSYVAAYGPCPTGNLQRVLGVKRSTITSLVDRLCKRELLERQADSGDGRVLLLAATRSGQRLAQKAVALAEELEARIRAQLSQRDVQALGRIVKAIDLATGITVVDHSSKEA